MYKYLFNFIFFLIIIIDYMFQTEGQYITAIVPALALNIAQLGLSGIQKGKAQAEVAGIELKLEAAKGRLENINFINKLNALSVPKNIRGQVAAERAETATVDALREAGARGVANIPKAVAATTDASIALTEEDRRAQFLADKAVMDQEQATADANIQKDMQQEYQEIYGLQQANKEQRGAINQANQSMAGAAGGIITTGLKQLNNPTGSFSQTERDFRQAGRGFNYDERDANQTFNQTKRQAERQFRRGEIDEPGRDTLITDAKTALDAALLEAQKQYDIAQNKYEGLKANSQAGGQTINNPYATIPTLKSIGGGATGPTVYATKAEADSALATMGGTGTVVYSQANGGFIIQ